MSIDRRRLTMRCPAGVSNAYVTRYVLIGAEFFQVCHLTFRLIDTEITVFIYQCNACTVISSILKALQSLDKNGVSVAVFS